MSKPTLSEVYDLARAKLGDDQVGGGEVFPDSTLWPHAASALRELNRALSNNATPFVLTERYFNLPAGAITIDPRVSINLDFHEPEIVEWRLVAHSISVTVTSGGQVASGSPHNFLDGDIVDISGVTGYTTFDSPNGEWVVSYSNSTQFSLVGCNASPIIPGASASGTATAGVGEFVPMEARPRLTGLGQVAGANPQPVYVWAEGKLRFMPSTQAREIRVLFRSSITPNSDPTSVIPFDDSLDYMAARTASLAAPAHGADETGARLKLEALGPEGETNLGSGGLLRQIVLSEIRTMQRTPFRRPPFRARRQGPIPILY